MSNAPAETNKPTESGKDEAGIYKNKKNWWN
jgi:hypothetical protein